MVNDPHLHAEQNTQELWDTLCAQVAQVTLQPGVYLMKDPQGRILYVGKALNLRKRLQSYFQKQRPHDPKTTVLLSKVASFETLITSTEKEALILESNLIKQHRPRYNIILKDDKRYPSLRLDLNQLYPNLSIVRKISKDGALYFGPYASSTAVRQTLKFIHNTFKLCKCNAATFKSRSRPCLYHQMGLCLAPCCLQVDHKTYHEILKEVIAFLRGRTPVLIRQIKRRMVQAAQTQEFEQAAQLRDKIVALEKTLERQITVTNDFKDRDVVGMILDEAQTVVTVLNIRGGFLQNVRHYFFNQAVGDVREQTRDFLMQYYTEANYIPSEIVVSHWPADKGFVDEFLYDKRKRKVELVHGLRGDKAKLIQMAEHNAINELALRKRDMEGHIALLQRLQKLLHLERLPRHIECFDNSNLSGTEPVAAMVVFENGSPQPSAYRRYKLHYQGKPDDYAYMSEVVRRRYERADQGKSWPDLLLLDGGKGQINVALTVLAELGLAKAFDVAGIAKKDPLRGEQHDKVYLAQRSNPVQFGRDEDLLLFVQRIRDEAHRWAVGFQRQRRRSVGLQSELDSVAGIGPRRKALLLQHFGGVRQIKAASVEQLQAVAGISPQLAATIKASLPSNDVEES